MAFVLRLLFAIVLIVPALAQAETGTAELNRQPRSHRKRLCRKYGICGNQGFGGQGYQQGYQGYPPAINIGISQSQSSASAGGGGYSSGYYPNNHQYNGFPNQGYGGYQGGYGGNQGYGGFQGRPGYFGNGQGGYNNQFNGNYYGPGAGNGGGYGFQGPFQGGYHDEPENHDEPNHNGETDDHNPHAQDDQENVNDYNHGPQGPHGPQSQGPYGPGQDYALSGSFAFAGRKNN